MNNQAVGLLVLDLIAGAVGLFALFRVWSTPAWTWRRGGWSKLAWSIAVVWLNVTFAHLVWPLGAILAILQARKNAAKLLPPAVAPIPWAEGTLDTDWWNVDPGEDTSESTGEPAGVHRGVCSTCGHFDEHWDEDLADLSDDGGLGPAPTDEELEGVGWIRVVDRTDPSKSQLSTDGQLPFGTGDGPAGEQP